MANTTLTHKMIARESAAILAEEAQFLMNVNRGRQDEFGANVNGFNKGDYVDIKIPPVGAVFDGAVFAGGGAATDSTETSVRLQLDTQKHIGIQFGAKEKLLEITDFKERILRPQIRTLSSVIEADLILKASQATPNVVGTVGTIPTTMKTYAQARAKLENYLAPNSDRTFLITSDANVELVDSSKQLFNASKQIEKNYLTGAMGEAQGGMWYEHQSMSVITNGTASGWTINGASQTGSSLNIGGLTAAQTIKKGSKFTIANVFAVHPLTGVATTTLQQFTVTADFTAAGTTGTISIFPAITPAAPNKTVSASPANGAATTMVGAASAAVRYNMHFQKDAYTVATAPLPVLASCEGYTARLPNGISVRVMTFGDGNNDYERTRIAVLYGFAAPRPLHSCLIAQ